MAKVLRDGVLLDVDDALFPPVPAIASPSRTAQLTATGVFFIANGLLLGMETAVGISAAFALEPGVYWIFFTDAQPDLAYSYNVTSSSGTINVSMRGEDMLEIRAFEGGVPTDPLEMSIQIARVL